MPVNYGKRRIRWAARKIAAPANPAMLRREMALVRGGAILESAAYSPDWGRYSIFTGEPLATFSIADSEEIDPFEALAGRLGPPCEMDGACELPFVGGWIGYFGYEAGRFVEPAAGWGDRPLRVPLAEWSAYDTVIIHDKLRNEWWVAGIEWPDKDREQSCALLEARLNALEARIVALREDATSAVSPMLKTGGPRWNYAADDYLEKVSRVIDYIHAGDIFQVNLARRLQIPVDVHPFEIYERLRTKNAATHAAYLPIRSARDAGSSAIVSSSPELFLRLGDGTALTRPIKGTRPRGTNAAADDVAAAELASSEKDRAELNMIIDLVRNDLGRVCEFGTVRVASDGAIELLPTVIHRTGTVTGRLRNGLRAMDLVRAAFPGGSITGAPKVRAMQIIHELEPDARGVYCGAIGYIGLDGSMQLNLPIRTMTIADNLAELHVGSGIVADSRPEEEYLELQAKARGMLAALGVTDDAVERPAVAAASI